MKCQKEDIFWKEPEPLMAIYMILFNPGAAKMYWDKVVPLVDLNIDGWFLDGPEPDHIKLHFYHFVRMGGS